VCECVCECVCVMFVCIVLSVYTLVLTLNHTYSHLLTHTPHTLTQSHTTHPYSLTHHTPLLTHTPHTLTHSHTTHPYSLTLTYMLLIYPLVFDDDGNGQMSFYEFAALFKFVNHMQQAFARADSARYVWFSFY